MDSQQHMIGAGRRFRFYNCIHRSPAGWKGFILRSLFGMEESDWNRSPVEDRWKNYDDI
jgi:hypothetical protein